jgi:hypothetical protein
MFSVHEACMKFKFVEVYLTSICGLRPTRKPLYARRYFRHMHLDENLTAISPNYDKPYNKVASDVSDEILHCHPTSSSGACSELFS